MGIHRVTPRILADHSLARLNDQTRRLMRIQEQLSSGQRINAPSDDPTGTRTAINMRARMAENEQYMASIRAIGPQLDETVSAAASAQSTIERARELSLQAANGTNSQAQLDAIALEVNQLLEGLVSNANYESNGRYLFAGTRTSAPPFTATRDANGDITAVTYAGNTDSVEAAIGSGVTVKAGQNGQEVFQAGVDAFQLLITIRDDLRSGDTNDLRDNRIADLNTARSQFLQVEARVGAVQNRLTRATQEFEEYNAQLDDLRSQALDTDYAEVIIDLNAQSNAYQAALNAAARVIQPSLLDFIQ